MRRNVVKKGRRRSASDALLIAGDTSKSNRGRIRMQPRMRSLITAQRIFRFSTTLRFALIRYHDCIRKRVSDAIRKIISFNDVVQSFRSIRLMLQREIAVLVERMIFDDFGDGAFSHAP